MKQKQLRMFGRRAPSFYQRKIIHDEKAVHRKHRIEEYNSEDGKEMIEERKKRTKENINTKG